MVKEYHDSCNLLFRARLQQQEAFNSARNKLRILLKELGEDYYYIGFVEHWNAHLNTLLRHQAQIQHKVAQEERAARGREEDRSREGRGRE